MPRVTIKTDYTSSDPWGITDANNIGINLQYILDENTSFSGVKTFNDGLFIPLGHPIDVGIGDESF